MEEIINDGDWGYIGGHEIIYEGDWVYIRGYESPIQVDHIEYEYGEPVYVCYVDYEPERFSYDELELA